MTLEFKLLEEAKESFADEFCDKIEELGYILAYGISKKDDSLAIAARVFYENPIPKQVKLQIEEILPRQFSYKGHDIPVELLYRPVPLME